MPKAGQRNLAVGTLFAMALVIVALAVMAVSGDTGLFRSRAQYSVVFPSAEGLTVGSPVQMAGVSVGTVTGIRLPTDPSEPGIVVQIGVDRQYAPRIREDSGAALRILLLLSGEKFVEVLPGSPDDPVLPEGSRIPLIQQPELFEQGEAIAENLNKITVALSNILGPLERGEGLIGQMIQDPEFGAEGLEALRGTLDNLERLTSDVIRMRSADYAGTGLLGRLLYDEALGTRLDDMGSAIEGFARIVDGVRLDEGALGELLAEGGSAEVALAELREASGSLKRLAAGLESGDGLLGRLLSDREYSDAMAHDLAATLHNMAEITDKINRGEGTLGALVNDRTVYDGAEDVLAGVNDSKFARWLLRHYRKKGIRSETAPDDSRP